MLVLTLTFVYEDSKTPKYVLHYSMQGFCNFCIILYKWSNEEMTWRRAVSGLIVCCDNWLTALFQLPINGEMW